MLKASGFESEILLDEAMETGMNSSFSSALWRVASLVSLPFQIERRRSDSWCWRQSPLLDPPRFCQASTWSCQKARPLYLPGSVWISVMTGRFLVSVGSLYFKGVEPGILGVVYLTVPYNLIRPHSSLDYVAPAVFASQVT